MYVMKTIKMTHNENDCQRLTNHHSPEEKVDRLFSFRRRRRRRSNRIDHKICTSLLEMMTMTMMSCTVLLLTCLLASLSIFTN